MHFLFRWEDGFYSIVNVFFEGFKIFNQIYIEWLKAAKGYTLMEVDNPYHGSIFFPSHWHSFLGFFNYRKGFYLIIAYDSMFILAPL